MSTVSRDPGRTMIIAGRLCLSKGVFRYVNLLAMEVAACGAKGEVSEASPNTGLVRRYFKRLERASFRCA